MAVGNANAQVRFFKVVDESAYRKVPARYEQISLPPSWGLSKMFVEKTSALTLSAQDVESIVIERKPVYRDPEATARELLGQKSTELPRDEKQAVRNYFQATFVLNRQGGLRFTQFAAKNDGKMFYVRVQNRPLDVFQMRGPFFGNTIAIGLREDDLEKLKSAFGGFGAKVTWK